MTNDQCPSPNDQMGWVLLFGHWGFVIDWSLGLGHWSFDAFRSTPRFLGTRPCLRVRFDHPLWRAAALARRTPRGCVTRREAMTYAPPRSPPRDADAT